MSDENKKEDDEHLELFLEYARNDSLNEIKHLVDTYKININYRGKNMAIVNYCIKLLYFVFLRQKKAFLWLECTSYLLLFQ